MTVNGYAATFEPYLLMATPDYVIYERIDPHAFDGADMTDVVMLFNHDGYVLARTTNQTLQLSVDSKGLKVTARLDGTQAGRDRFEEIKGKYLQQMSFAFTVKDDVREVVEESAQGRVTILRTIKAFDKILDVSAVTRPANPGTTISARTLTDKEREQLIRKIKMLIEV